MMRSLYSGVAGLKNHQTKMDVVGNNIANVNTVGYKAGRTTFQDMLSQSIKGASSPIGTTGGVNPLQIGLGMGVASVDNIFTNGSLQATGKNTDLAIDGDGFFMVKNGLDTYYTRAGNFDFDAQGNYVIPGTGLQVLGWLADADGNINTQGPLSTINVPIGLMMPPKASTTILVENNLSDKTANTSIDVYDSLGQKHTATITFEKIDTSVAAIPWGDYFAKAVYAASIAAQEVAAIGGNALNAVTAAANAATQSVINAVSINTVEDVADIVRNIQAVAAAVFPSGNNIVNVAINDAIAAGLTAAETAVQNGSTVQQAITDVQNAVNNRAIAAVNAAIALGSTPSSAQIAIAASAAAALAASDATKAAAADAVQSVLSPNQWYVTFYVTDTDHGDSSTAYTGMILFDLNGEYIRSSMPDCAFNPNSGNMMTITPDFSTLTQYSGENTVAATKTDGYTAGILDRTSISIDATGIIFGYFDNAKLMNMGQIALASFTNPGGLSKVGSSLFAVSNNSGIARIGTPGNGGLSTVTASTLEMSNVDMSEEFTSMITTQRGFQANSRIITTSDTMLEELINLKR